MTLTDKIIFFTGIYLFWRGWSKGLTQTILGPVALFAGSALSYFYYILSHNLLAAIAIGIVGPIIINVILSTTLGMLFPSADGKKHSSLLSRFGGALLNTLWGEFFLIAVIFLLLMIPLQLPGLNKAQADIQNSIIYAQLKPTLNKYLPNEAIPQYDPSKFVALSDPKVLETIEKSKEYQDLINDERIQALLNDPSVTGQVKEKDLSKLLQNPKFIALTRDPELLKKFLALYSTMLKNAQTDDTETDADLDPSEPL